MPTYEYACKSCGEHLEVVQSFKDDPLTECPNCGGSLRKVFGNIGIAFKGSGFYKNDSRTSAGGSKSSEKTSETKTSETKSSETGTSETKTSETKTSESSTSKPAETKSSEPAKSTTASSSPAATKAS